MREALDPCEYEAGCCVIQQLGIQVESPVAGASLGAVFTRIRSISFSATNAMVLACAPP
jgi:hypothetical protein